jgi:UDP-N-acetylmuramoylalanine--D-glutamate ligase
MQNKSSEKNKILEELKNSTIVILGLGAEGLSSYHFLRKNFPKKKIALADQTTAKDLNSELKKIKKNDPHLIWHLGKNYHQKLADYQIIIKTAGIPITEKFIATAIKKGSQVSSNTKIFFDLCQGMIVGITGTKGKSTTSTLTYQILKNAGFDTVLVGNIGQPPLNLLEKIKTETIVVNELSSHQLAQLEKSPEIAIVQDIKPEHLDYYKDFEEYFAAKTAIAKYQNKNNILIYNPDLEGSSRMAKLSPAKKITHRLAEKNAVNSQAKVFQKNEALFYKKSALLPAEKIIDKKEIPLLGEHNLYNIMPAIIVAKIFDVPTEIIKKTIINFKSLDHRLELVAEVNNVKYYDDSIATNPHAAIMALQAFPKNSVVLLAGGHERNQDFSEYAAEIVKQQVKAILLFPSTGERILQFIKKVDPHFKIESHLVKDMKEAVKIASKISKAGDVVLLSPAAASFGLFKNYKDRGQQFAQAAKALKNK